MKKRLLFFHFDLGDGGAENVLVNLLNALDTTKYDITLRTIFSGEKNRKRLSSSIKFKPLFNRKPFRGMKIILKLFSPALLNKILIRENYDIRIAFLEGISTRIVGGKKSKDNKLYAWVHTTITSPNTLQNAFRSVSEVEKVYNNFDKIAFVSHDAKINFEKFHQYIKINKEIVHNIYDYNNILKLSYIPSTLPINPNLINIVTVGRLTQVKRHDRVIKSLSSIFDQGIRNWHLYIVGKGELEKELKDLVISNDLNDNITFVGYNTNPYNIISQMDLFICSSEREGFSTAASEAAFLGVPILTTDCGGMEEIVQNEFNGIIVPNTDQGINVGLNAYFSLTDKERANFKKNAISKQKNFSKTEPLREFEQFIFNF